MGRLASGVAALAFAVASAPAGAPAQALATLHVPRFSIAADRTSVRTGEPFHVTLTVHVQERIAELDNVTLPDLAGIDVSGDERRCSPAPRGTDCSETLTLAASVPGDRSIGPWTMDAVDARNHRASRFSSNTIVVRVSGPSPLVSVGETLRDLSLAALTALGVFVLAGAALWGLLRVRRSRRPVLALEPVPPPEPPPVPPPETSLRELIEALAREPSRARAVALRAALRARAGAREDETDADLVARRALPDAGTVAALRAVERAAFCEEARVADAAREALTFLTH